jgi:hypothetical protein
MNPNERETGKKRKRKEEKHIQKKENDKTPDRSHDAAPTQQRAQQS